MKRLVIVIFILHAGINSFAQKPMQTEFDSLIGKGREYLSLGKIEDAIQIFTTAIDKDSSRMEGFYGLGVSYFLKNDPLLNLAAINCFSKAIEIDPSHHKAYFNRGSCYAKSGNYEEALSDFNKAIELASTSGEYYYNRAYINFKLDKKKEGCNDLDQAKKYKFKFDEKLYEQCN
jgi:tetratricopeptide (TPR) repeat protein